MVTIVKLVRWAVLPNAQDRGVECKLEIPSLKCPGPLSNAENHGIRGCKEKPGNFSLSSQKGQIFSSAFLKETDPVNDDNISHSLNAHIKAQL